MQQETAPGMTERKKAVRPNAPGPDTIIKVVQNGDRTVYKRITKSGQCLGPVPQPRSPWISSEH